MEHQPAAANPTCALKVNIQCCTGCRVKARKKLQKLNGVDSITFDTEQGIVRISGNVDPTVLIHKFAQLGKKAELLSLDDKTKDQLTLDRNDDDDDDGGSVPPIKTQNESTTANNQSSNKTTSTKKRFWCFTTKKKNKEVSTSSNVYGGANLSSKFPAPAATNRHFWATATPMPAGYGPYNVPPLHLRPMPVYGGNVPMLPPHNGMFFGRGLPFHDPPHRL